MKRLKVLATAAALVGGFGIASAAQAAPFSPAPAAAMGSAAIQQVDWACGPGFHVNPWGRCRPNWRPRPYWGGPVGFYGPPRRFYRPYGYGPRPFYRPYGYYGPRPFY